MGFFKHLPMSSNEFHQPPKRHGQRNREVSTQGNFEPSFFENSPYAIPPLLNDSLIIFLRKTK